MLTAQSQKADYYHLESLVRPSPRYSATKIKARIEGEFWETTQQISFSLATREHIREGPTICAIVRREAECRRALVT
jgi:hypothetical protein